METVLANSLGIGLVVALFLGAYLGLVADRLSYWLHVSKRFLWRKNCPECFSVLRWKSYLPIFGHLLEKGICRNCKTRLPIKDVWLELISGLVLGVLWLVLFAQQGWGGPIQWIAAILICLIFVGFLILAISDLVYDEVPVGIFVATFILLSAYIFYVYSWETLIWQWFAGIICGLVMLALLAITHWQWVHGHDILFGVLVGMLVGWPGLVLTLGLAYVLAIMGGLISWGWNKPVWRGASFFGVYLFLALLLQGALTVLSWILFVYE